MFEARRFECPSVSTIHYQFHRPLSAAQPRSRLALGPARPLARHAGLSKKEL